MTRPEPMRPGFTKFHVDGLPFDAVFHHITSADGEEAHDHPFGFRSFVLDGWYNEEIWVQLADRVHVTQQRRGTGFVQDVPANRVHRIINMPESGCWTLILPGPPERDTCFYRLVDGRLESRAWNGVYEEPAHV